MGVNDLTFNQLSTVLNEINKQANGGKTIDIVNTADFVSVATATLKAGYDPVLNAISQVLSGTIFSIRPYSAKFKGLMQTNQRYGNHVRKLQIADKDAVDDSKIDLTDGKSVDMFVVNKPNILQTNFYGQNVYSRFTTLFKDQLDVAFTTPDEFARFVSMVMQNASDLLEKDRENVARMSVGNFIAGKIAGDTSNVIHLVSEYNDVIGGELTSETVLQPENFAPFIRWAFSRIQTIADFMTERSLKYHVNIDGKEISRHTPYRNQKMYLQSTILNSVNTEVMSTTFNTDFLKLADHEKVNYWQSIDTPYGINIKPTYIDTTGAITTSKDAVVQSHVLGALFDDEAIGINLTNQWSSPTPFNSRGGYSNIYWHETARYYNDFTENGVVFLLD